MSEYTLYCDYWTSLCCQDWLGFFRIIHVYIIKKVVKFDITSIMRLRSSGKEISRVKYKISLGLNIFFPYVTTSYTTPSYLVFEMKEYQIKMPKQQ